MARYVGIDITPTVVRAALVRTGFRTVAVDRLLEVDRGRVETLEQALQTCVLPLLEAGEPLAVAVDGEQSFLHRLAVPVRALKQLEQVLPFEVEAQVPVEFDELVYDYRLLPREKTATELTVLAAAVRRERVRELVDLVHRALGREPERVGCGPLPLVNLTNLSLAFAEPGPLALVEVGETRTETVVLVRGELRFARTVARGMVGLPEGAPALAAELRQTFAAWAATGDDPIVRVVLLGIGGQDPYAAPYLAHALGIPVEPITERGFAPLPPETAGLLPRFAKAMALAAGLSKPHDLNLRQGALAFQRGYAFFKERAPLLLGLGGAMLVSFLFATWAEVSTLSREHEALVTTLSALSKAVLGEETADPERAQQLLETGDGRILTDPMPHADAFDALVGISEAIPLGMTHDIDEFDLQRGKVRINGIVPTAADAQKVVAALKKVRCVDVPKISKISQVVNSDRQKYVLEFDLRCPEDAPKTKPKKAGEDTAAAPAPAEGKP